DPGFRALAAHPNARLLSIEATADPSLPRWTAPPLTYMKKRSDSVEPIRLCKSDGLAYCGMNTVLRFGRGIMPWQNASLLFRYCWPYYSAWHRFSVELKRKMPGRIVRSPAWVSPR